MCSWLIAKSDMERGGKIRFVLWSRSSKLQRLLRGGLGNCRSDYMLQTLPKSIQAIPCRKLFHPSSRRPPAGTDRAISSPHGHCAYCTRRSCPKSRDYSSVLPYERHLIPCVRVWEAQTSRDPDGPVAGELLYKT